MNAARLCVVIDVLPEVNWESWPVAALAAFFTESMMNYRISISRFGEI